MNTSEDNDLRRKKRTRFLLLAYLCFFLGSLFSGADGSFFGIGFAATVFFAFMALMNLPKGKEQSAARPTANPGPPPPVNPAHSPRQKVQIPETENFPDQLGKVFQRARSKFDAAPRENKARIIVVVFISGMIVFFLIVFNSIDSDNGYSESDLAIAQAENYYNSGNFDSAALYYRSAMLVDPTLASAFRGLGNVKLTREQYDSSQYFFKQALGIDPDDEVALNGLGMGYFYTQQYDTALAQCKHVLELNPSNGDALLLAGDCFYTKELYDSAIRYYEPGYTLGRRSRLLCHIMAFIYDKKGEIDKAIPLYEEALTYDTTIVDIYQRLTEIAPTEKANYYRTKMQQLPH